MTHESSELQLASSDRFRHPPTTVARTTRLHRRRRLLARPARRRLSRWSRSAPASAAGGAVGGAPDVSLSITPAESGIDDAPEHGITVRAAGGRITKVAVDTGGEPVSGKLRDSGTVWRSTWALDVSQHFTVVATAVGRNGIPITRTVSFRTLTRAKPSRRRSSRGIARPTGWACRSSSTSAGRSQDRAAVERALQVRSSKRVVGAWYWDTSCNLAAMCVYFRPRSYWPAHTRRELHRSPRRRRGRARRLRQPHADADVHDRRRGGGGGEHAGALHDRLPRRPGLRRAGRSAPGGPATKPPTGRT